MVIVGRIPPSVVSHQSSIFCCFRFNSDEEKVNGSFCSDSRTQLSAICDTSRAHSSVSAKLDLEKSPCKEVGRQSNELSPSFPPSIEGSPTVKISPGMIHSGSTGVTPTDWFLPSWSVAFPSLLAFGTAFVSLCLMFWTRPSISPA